MALKRNKYSEGSLRGIVAYCGGLLLLLFRKACLHIGVGLRSNGRVLFRTGGSSLFTGIHVGIKPRRLSVTLVHFLVLLLLWPFRARFRLALSRTIVPFLVWERSGPPFPAKPRRRRSVHRSSEAFLTAGFLFNLR